MDPLKHSNLRRAASDLLRWSMGAKPHDGRNFVDYEPPPNPAVPPLTIARALAATRGWFRDLGIRMLRAVLIWWLSFDEKRDGRG